jgi:C4-dicarboxylate-specific signal transduction histidine kinase
MTLQTFFTPNREIKTFLVDEAVNEAINLLEKKLKKSMVDISVGLQNAYTVGVKNELTQVIINIINNSIDAFEKNGVLIRNLDIASGVKNGEVYISIKDNAGGVSKKIIDRIFEPYFTTKHQKSGTGLGLFMSKMICEQGMGGSIDVKSSKNQTTFTIKIPQDR